MNNKKGEFAKEALLMLVTIAITSALVFSLVQFGFIEVSGQASNDDFLNAEFVPYERSGELTIRNFRFCDKTNSESGCLVEQNIFQLGEEVHFFFDVASSVYGGDLVLTENFRLIDPSGRILLEVNNQDNFNIERKSGENVEFISLKDGIFLDAKEIPGVYTLELIIENPVTNKKATLTKQFTAVQ